MCLHRLDNNGTSQDLLVTLPNHTPMTCTGKKTGKDIFLYHFFLVLPLFPLKLNLVYSSHRTVRTYREQSVQTALLTKHSGDKIVKSRAPKKKEGMISNSLPSQVASFT